MFETLIVANGDIPSKALWSDIHYSFLLCTDGAAKKLKSLNLEPNAIIGDFDSLPNPAIEFPQSQIQKVDDQNTTDFEKALQYCMKFSNKNIVCVGALGGFADHALHNLSLLLRYSQHLDLCLLNPTAEGREWIFALKPHTRICTPENSLISFFPFPEATLTASTLEWPLDRTHLTQIGNAAVRNRTTSKITEITCTGACLCFVGAHAYPLAF